MQGTATTYSTTKRIYKVGILLLDSTNIGDGRGPENPDPFVFFIADSRADVKPQNWEFVNPLAPGTVTEEVKTRWDNRDPSSPYQLGQAVTKNMAAYWEVSLTKASQTDLLQFDLLFITNHRETNFSPADRERLRKLVDAGGIVWIEDCGNMRLAGNPAAGRPYSSPFFLDQLQFSNGGTGANSGPIVNVPTHPILNTPYQLSTTEIANLGDKNYGTFALNSIDTTNANLDTTLETAPNPETLINIVGNSARPDVNHPTRGLPYIAAGNYGSGAILATSSDSGCDINDYAGGVNAGAGGNSGALCGPNIITAHSEDLKFLYNTVAWGGANNTYRRNNRRTATSFDAVGAPLVTAFNFAQAANPIINRPDDVVNSLSAPLIVKGIMFVAGVDQGGNATLRAYDTQPFRDLDGDGSFDEGRPDISLGLPYDEIWRYTGAAAAGVQPSAPIYASAVNNAGNPSENIYVSLADGTLVSLQAFPIDGSGRLSATPAIIASTNPTGGVNGVYDPALAHGVAPSPVFSENKLFQVQPNGMVRALDARNNALIWQSFQAAAVTIRPTGTPTLGFSRQSSDATFARNSNGTTNDLMLYVPVQITPTSGPAVGTVLSYWIGTRNEVQRGFQNDADGQAGRIKTRIAGGFGGPSKDQFFMGALAPYIRPVVRVYSSTPFNPAPGAVVTTAQENYANNVISPDYTGQVIALPGATSGMVQITTRAGSAAGAPRPGIDVLISVDYDVEYIGAANGAPPAYNTTTLQIGARRNTTLGIPNYVSGLDTPAFSTEDTLVYSAVQQNQGTGGGNFPLVASVFGVNEQEGQQTSRSRWRFSLFGDTTNGGLLNTTVDGANVQDLAPLQNYLQFNNNYPSPNNAVIRKTAGGATNPEPLIDVRPVGPPIVTNNGLTYVLARAISGANGNAPVTVLMAFKTDPTITLNLSRPFDPAFGVTVSQTDALSDPANPQTVSASSAGSGTQLFLDGERGNITITNFEANGGRSFSASQTFVVRYTPIGSTNQRTVAISPLPASSAQTIGLGVGDNGTRTQAGGFTPLQWYYVLPGDPFQGASGAGAATLVGDFIYYTARIGAGTYLIAVDADPTASDGEIRVGFGEQIRSVVDTLIDGATTINVTNNHVRMVQQIVGDAGSPVTTASVAVGTQGILAVNTNVGTFALQPGTTLIADAKRLVEADASAAISWALEGTLERSVKGGELPIFDGTGGIANPPANGRTALDSKPLSRPTSVRKISASDYLVADTGNNRAVRVDRSGFVRWSLDTFEDPYKILGSGDALGLNEPNDVQFYTAPTPGGGYEVHYLVADTGNFRIIEVADYFDNSGRATNAPNAPGTAGRHVLVWTTRTNSQGRKLRYQSVQRYLGTVTVGGTQYFGYPSITAVIGNSGQASGDTIDYTGGALVNIAYSPFSQTFAVRDTTGAVTPLTPWIFNANAVSTEPVSNGTVLSGSAEVRIVDGGGGISTKRIAKPRFFQRLSVPVPGSAALRTVYLICDGDGAYAVEETTNAGVLRREVIWFFTQANYNAINGLANGANDVGTVIPSNATYTPRLGFPVPPLGNFPMSQMPTFVPSSIQLLPSGNYLITNSYAGKSSLFETGQFTGEVLEITPPAGGSVLNPTRNGTSVIAVGGGTYGGFSVPRLKQPRAGINVQLMGDPANTALVEQPLFASRP